MLLHATGIVHQGWAALLTGPSGAGKSDLALRMIDRGWTLLADDQVLLRGEKGILTAHAPAATVGLIEVRGVGIVRLESVACAPVALTVALGPEPERLPEPALCMLLGVPVAAIALDPRPASAPIKLGYAFVRALAALGERSDERDVRQRR